MICKKNYLPLHGNCKIYNMYQLEQNINLHVSVDCVYREGITGVTPLDVLCGKEFGLTLKLLAGAKEEDGKIQLFAAAHEVIKVGIV